MTEFLIRLLRVRFFFNYFILCINKKSNANYTLLIPKFNLMYFFRVNFIWDLATLINFKNNNISYNIVFGLKNINKIVNSKVIYNPGYEINYWNIEYDVAFFPLLSKVLENQSNCVIPSSYEINFWENKSFMHNKFNNANIVSPKTYIVNSTNINFVISEIDRSSRWLFKPNHSKSSLGIIEIKDNLNSFLINELKSNKEVVLQKIIDIDRDCRIIIVEGKVALQYWRNKVESKEWIPTSTSSGSTVTFMDYSEFLSNWAINATNKLKLRSAAWDIVFDINDKNLENPMALEVSPVYYPNPRENYLVNTAYKEYKNNINYDKYLLKEFIFHVNLKTSHWYQN